VFEYLFSDPQPSSLQRLETLTLHDVSEEGTSVRVRSNSEWAAASQRLRSLTSVAVLHGMPTVVEPLVSHLVRLASSLRRFQFQSFGCREWPWKQVVAALEANPLLHAKIGFDEDFPAEIQSALRGLPQQFPVRVVLKEE
jgi:hypothetical protein